MGERYNGRKRRTWLIPAFGVSVILHLIMLVFSVIWEDMFLLEGSRDNDSVAEQNRRMTFEFIETPDDADEREHSQPSNLVSDKQLRARDKNTQSLASAGHPFQQGRSDLKSITAGGIHGSALDYRNADKNQPASLQDMTESRSPDGILMPPPFHKDRLTVREPFRALSSPAGAPDYHHTESSVPEFGSIRFNTYNWEYAPYLRKLKKRIQEHIFPPPIFTHLGFGGKNIIRFRIFLDGSTDEPALLGYAGEKALAETSEDAVRLSTPFWPLPVNFPEEYLEVTAEFHYIGYQ